MAINKYSMFPIDNKKRIVTAYGKVHRVNVSVPEVSVHVEIVDIDKKEVYMIPCIYLHEIKIGTVIQNQENMGYSILHKDRYEGGIKFSFDFNENEPENIIFVKDMYEDEWIWGREHPYDNNTINNMKPQTGTVFAKLKNINGIIVYVPSLELLFSGYAPRARRFIPYLCNFPLDVAIKYIKKLYIIEEKAWFFDRIRKDKFPKAKNSCMNYLTHHPVTRARASIIHQSIVLTEKNKGAYIAVLPYHPEKMTMTVSGVWIDEEKFVVQRINEISKPAGHLTVPLEPVYVEDPREDFSYMFEMD